MENLNIAESKYTPKINLNADLGLIELSGKSYPENTFEFYKPFLRWIEEYLELNVKEKTVVNMQIIYLNSSSSKLFFDFFDILESNQNKTNLEINWKYDKLNESALEAGEDFIDDFDSLNINLVEI